jgi:hypothetical protein
MFLPGQRRFREHGLDRHPFNRPPSRCAFRAADRLSGRARLGPAAICHVHSINRGAHSRVRDEVRSRATVAAATRNSMDLTERGMRDERCAGNRDYEEHGRRQDDDPH